MRYVIISVGLRLMDSLGAPDLSPDLLARPSGSIDSPILKFPVAPRLSDHGYQPLSAIVLRELAVRKGVCEIPRRLLEKNM